MGELIQFPGGRSLCLHERVRLKRQPDRPYFAHDVGSVLGFEHRPDELEPRVYVSWDLGVNHRRRAWHPASELQGSVNG